MKTYNRKVKTPPVVTRARFARFGSPIEGASSFKVIALRAQLAFGNGERCSPLNPLGIYRLGQ